MIEFSGTLLGFDDYVSALQPSQRALSVPLLTRSPDMVLEDVTELYGPGCKLPAISGALTA